MFQTFGHNLVIYTLYTGVQFVWPGYPYFTLIIFYKRAQNVAESDFIAHAFYIK